MHQHDGTPKNGTSGLRSIPAQFQREDKDPDAEQDQLHQRQVVHAAGR